MGDLLKQNITKVRKTRINILAIIGMMVAIGTVAFTAPNKATNNAFNWYAVESGNTINPTPIPAPSNSGNCRLSYKNDLCAIEILSEDVPATVTEAETLGVDGARAHSKK